MNITECKKGMIVKSAYNNFTDYRITKVNKKSINVQSLTGAYNYNGLDPEDFYVPNNKE